MSNKHMPRPKFSIILVNYKSYDVTTICMHLLKKAVDVSETPIIVVDNGSNDESLSYLKSLDWITLIERVPVEGEPGFMAHGRGLDLAMQAVHTDYVLLLHTDTFIHDPAILDLLFEKTQLDARIAAVGCLEPVLRSRPTVVRRYVVRGIKYYFRRLKLALGIKTRPPKLHYETYMKSFCTLWNVNIMRRHGMSFSMGEQVPGYEMQDRLRELGYQFEAIPPRIMFSFLDHIEKASPSAMTGSRVNFRKVTSYKAIIEKTRSSTASSNPRTPK